MCCAYSSWWFPDGGGKAADADGPGATLVGSVTDGILSGFAGAVTGRGESTNDRVAATEAGAVADGAAVCSEWVIGEVAASAVVTGASAVFTAATGVVGRDFGTCVVTSRWNTTASSP